MAKRRKGLRGLGGTPAEHRSRGSKLLGTLLKFTSVAVTRKSCRSKIGDLATAENMLGMVEAEFDWAPEMARTSSFKVAKDRVRKLRYSAERCVCTKGAR